MSVKVWTAWASPKGEEPAPWMVAAEDDVSYEADPDRCDRVFQTARDLCDRNGWDYREITIEVDDRPILAAFETGRTTGIARVPEGEPEGALPGGASEGSSREGGCG